MTRCHWRWRGAGRILGRGLSLFDPGDLAHGHQSSAHAAYGPPVKPARAAAHSGSEDTEPAQGRLRRLNLTTLLPPIAVGGMVVVAMDSRTWWDVAFLSLGVAAALLAFVRWAVRGGISRVTLPCLIITAAVWAFGALATDSRSAFFGVSVVGPLAVSRMRRHRGAAAVALTVFVALVGAARPLVTQESVPDILLPYVIVPAGFTAVLTGFMFPNKRFYDLVEELEESREREAELAVIRERMRFASDLHDIQGHTLHMVKLKTALAQKLVRSDSGRAEEELREIHALVADTITQTKELAYAQRRLSLPAELENARNLFEAAGIRVRVDRDADVGARAGAEVDARAGELLGQVLRETTTNILRHAQAEQVRITLSATGITIVNDGAQETPLPQLRGLATLKERVADGGGELTVEQEHGRFLTAARLSRPRPAAPPRTRKDHR
ncbi:histidine kinase [Streptomyces sp. NPDC094034]|uniref:sensor histidine kinase n=1 Tax=Streptomyces sp. NPDC094034 TaxID=3155309 RepID=UPI00332BA395